MVERVDAETRHRIMSANQGKNTQLEIEIRKALFKRGLRYRTHTVDLPGKPDIVLPRYHTAVFVHGCFWHGHECPRRPQSKTNTSFWNGKIAKNRDRDLVARNRLLELGWRVLVIWECAVRRRNPEFGAGPSVDKVLVWIRGKGRLAILSESGFEECL
jgi:DNA mismatch endonuclease, patch repair protein